MLEKLNLFDLTGLITLVPLIWKWMGLLLKKKHLLRCWDRLSFLNLIGGSYIASIAKTASKKIGDLIHFIRFLSPEVALYIYDTTILTCM